jgi:glycine/D-amino acid oxidase-like deaminating enzyme
MTPGLHLRQISSGRLVAGTDFTGNDPVDSAEALAEELQSKVEGMVKGAQGLGLDGFTIGYRPTPADGFSAIGRPQSRDGLYTIVTHSGVTLAPALGQFAAQEILTGMRDPLIAPFGPSRASLI